MEIRHVDVLSLARMLGAIYLIGGFIAGVLFALLMGVSALIGGPAETAGAPLVIALGGLVFAPIFYGALGFLSGAFAALLYNVFARLVGGIRIELAGAVQTGAGGSAP